MKRIVFVLLILLVSASPALATTNSVVYQLTNEPGTFYTTMDGVIPLGIHNLVIFSSSENTIFNELQASEMPDNWKLDVQAIYEGVPKINAFVDTPVMEGEKRLYHIKAMFEDDSALYEDGINLVFKRKTNFNKIKVVLPQSYKVLDATPAMLTTTEQGGYIALTLDNPDRHMVELNITFTEDDSLVPAYPDLIRLDSIERAPLLDVK